MTWTEFCCALVDQAAIQSVPDEAAILRAHLERVLRILDTGEYRRAEDQAAIVAARELVAAPRAL